MMAAVDRALSKPYQLKYRLPPQTLSNETGGSDAQANKVINHDVDNGQLRQRGNYTMKLLSSSRKTRILSDSGNGILHL